MIEQYNAIPQLPKDGEVLEDVACGCCGEKGNVVTKIKQAKGANQGDAYTFECDPQRANKDGKKGCGMSITRSSGDILRAKTPGGNPLPRDVYVASEMESAYTSGLGKPHHPR